MACNYFQSRGPNIGFYSCKHLRENYILGTCIVLWHCSASWVHSSLIEKTPAAALWQFHSLACNTIQRIQRSHKNKKKRSKKNSRHAVCLLSFWQRYSMVGLLTAYVGVKWDSFKVLK